MYNKIRDKKHLEDKLLRGIFCILSYFNKIFLPISVTVPAPTVRIISFGQARSLTYLTISSKLEIYVASFPRDLILFTK